MANNGTVDYGNTGNVPSKGITSNMINRQTKNEFSNKVFEQDTGYIDTLIRKLEEQNKAMQNIIKSGEKLSKTQKKSYDQQIKDNDLVVNGFKKLKETRSASYGDITKQISSATKAIKKSLEQQGKLLDKNSEHYEQQLNYMYNELSELEKYNDTLKETDKILNNTQKSFAKGMSESLGTFSSELRELSNMFNLKEIADSSVNTYIRDKMSVQNDIMKQFGMQSVSQYVSFKNNLDSTLNNMNSDLGNLFNSNDMKNYLNNIGSLGITDTTMAQEQMRSSILATKYLGVSNETQQEIFKYMKRTNDYTMLDNHNKTITGILKAQLGVSTEQLDMMSQQALSNVDALAGLGLSPEVQENFVESYTKSQAALTNLYGEKTANYIMGAVSEFANSDYTNMMSLSNRYGYGADAAYNNFINSGDVSSLIQFLIGNAGFANKGTGGFRATLQGQLGQDRNFNAAILSANYDDYTDKMDDIQKAIDNGGSVDDFITSTTELTTVDKIANWLDSFINGLDWASYIDLSTAAFAFWGASKVFDIINFFSQAKSIGFLKNGMSALLGKAGIGTEIAGMSGLMTTGLTVGLSAAAIGAMAVAIGGIIKSTNKSMDIGAQDTYEQTMSSTGNHAWSAASGIADASSNLSGDLSGTWSFVKYLGSGKSKTEKNKALLEWMYRGGAFNTANNVLMTAYLLDSVGDLEVFKDVTGYDITRDDLKTFLESGIFSEDYLNTNVNSQIIDSGWKFYTNNKGGRTDKFILDKKLYGIGGLGDIGFGGGGRDMSFKPYGITAGYPYYPSGKRHRGVDFGFHENTPIGATVGGIVQYVKDSGSAGYGRHVLVHGADGKYYLYGHMNRPMVSNGQQVTSGQLLGYSGNTGNSTGPHLHYEVRNSASYGSDIDPYPYINSSLWSIGQASPEPIASSAPSSTEGASSTSNMPIATRRALPSDFSNSVNGTGGAGTEAIINSADGNMTRLLKFLSDVKGEQDLNREILNAYSRANSASIINI